MLQLIEKGVATGQFTSRDPKMAATALLSLGIDIARWYREDGQRSPEDIAEYYADTALRIVGAARPTPDDQQRPPRRRGDEGKG